MTKRASAFFTTQAEEAAEAKEAVEEKKGGATEAGLWQMN